MDIINLLEAMYPNEKISTGELTLSSVKVSEAGEAWKKLREFGGSGWVCQSRNPVILQFSEGDNFPEEPSDWILSAEAVKGDKSLRVTRQGALWEFSIIRRVSSDEKCLLLEKTLLCSHGGSMRYEIEWKLSAVGDGEYAIEEYRPAVCRFIGFTENQKEA